MAMTRDFVFVSASGLHVSVTFDGESQTLLEFYREYDKAFVLPNEKEELAGFQECLALNHGAVHDTLSKRYGEFREPCFVARETPEGPIVGGGNLIALPLEGRVTANLNYLFVSSAFRGKGFFRKVLGAALELTSRLFESPAAPLVFFEQNDPLAMSAEAYARDTEATGIDQVDRLRIWARVGARLVDFDYVQPPLSEMHSADHTLLYAVLGAEGPSIGSCLLAEHLSRFFAISVAKGKELGGVAREQVEALRELCTRGEEIALLEYGMYLSDVVGNNPVDALKVRHKNLRSAVKSAALGSLHWTISLYIDNDRLPARLRAALDPTKAHSVQGMTESASLRDAI